MEKIDSFKVDHTKLLPGVYVSRVDKFGEVTIKTFDLRVCKPGVEMMDSKGVHTVEHIMATLLRNSIIKDDVVYFGPMGCLTGFYLILKGEWEPGELIEILYNGFEIMAFWKGDIPGASAAECGSPEFHSLEEAKKIAFMYLKTLKKIYTGELKDRTEYPK